MSYSRNQWEVIFPAPVLVLLNLSSIKIWSMKYLPAKLDGVKTYMRLRRVPTNIQNKVIKWFDYLWLTQKSSDEERAISCLPGESEVLKRVIHL